MTKLHRRTTRRCLLHPLVLSRLRGLLLRELRMRLTASLYTATSRRLPLSHLGTAALLSRCTATHRLPLLMTLSQLVSICFASFVASLLVTLCVNGRGR